MVTDSLNLASQKYSHPSNFNNTGHMWCMIVKWKKKKIDFLIIISEPNENLNTLWYSCIQSIKASHIQRLNEQQLITLIFKSCNRFLFQFTSELWLGHSYTLICCSHCFSGCIFTLLDLLKTSFLPGLWSSKASNNRLIFKAVLCLASSTFPSTLNRLLRGNVLFRVDGQCWSSATDIIFWGGQQEAI